MRTALAIALFLIVVSQPLALSGPASSKLGTRDGMGLWTFYNSVSGVAYVGLLPRSPRGTAQGPSQSLIRLEPHGVRNPRGIRLSQDQGEFHRKTAAKCFNGAWEYLDRGTRGPMDDREMLHLAHASRYHWGLVGTPMNLAVGDWQISRIYAALDQPDLALMFARSSLEICEKNNLSGILTSAYEGMARAYAVAKDFGAAKEWIEKARGELENSVDDPDDREIFLGQIVETEALIKP